MAAVMRRLTTTCLESRPWRWWTAPLPRGRIAALRSALYAFVVIDVLVLTPWVQVHGSVPPELYSPLFIGRLLPFPVPTEGLTIAIKVALLICAVVAVAGRLPRLLGTVVFCLYFEWMMIAFSYGKVDHDRFAFLVALAVLPTVGGARWRDQTGDEAAGWAIRWIQVAVVATYFLSVFAKWRFGGIEWVNSATLLRVILRRGTFLADPLVDYPWILNVGQYFIVAFELASPLMLAPGRLGKVAFAFAVAFHVITFAAIEIMFWPHVVCLLAFVPLERLGRRGAVTRQARSAPLEPQTSM